MDISPVASSPSHCCFCFIVSARLSYLRPASGKVISRLNDRLTRKRGSCDHHDREVSRLPPGPIRHQLTGCRIKPSLTEILVLPSSDGTGQVLDLSGGKGFQARQSSATLPVRAGVGEQDLLHDAQEPYPLIRVNRSRRARSEGRRATASQARSARSRDPQRTARQHPHARRDRLRQKHLPRGRH